jgi:hypothetical protein
MSKNASEPAMGWPWTFRWPSATAASAALPFFDLAPERLAQPINPGWSFGNVILNTGNSSAPEVEQSVVSHHSYGRQIGRLMEAVSALAQALPKTASDPRIEAFNALAIDVERIKREAAQTRIERLRVQLQELKECDPEGFRDLWAKWDE